MTATQGVCADCKELHQKLWEAVADRNALYWLLESVCDEARQQQPEQWRHAMDKALRVIVYPSE